MGFVKWRIEFNEADRGSKDLIVCVTLLSDRTKQKLLTFEGSVLNLQAFVEPALIMRTDATPNDT